MTAKKKTATQSSIAKHKMPSRYWRGSFSKVRAHATYVVKTLKTTDKFIHTSWLNEISALRACSTIPNIPRLISTSVDFEKNDYKITMSRCPGYPIDYIYKRIVLTEQVVFSISYQLFETLVAVHAKNLKHYDIKLENLMYDPESGLVSLIDFGFCCKGALHSFCGSSSYAASELIDASIAFPKGSDKSDMYSAGACVYFLICMLFKIYSVDSVVQRPFPWADQCLTPTLTFLSTLAEQLLAPAHQRPSAEKTKSCFDTFAQQS